MSFTTKVKDELMLNIQKARHCRIAELAALTCFMGDYDINSGVLRLVGENKPLLEKSEKIIKKIFPVDNEERIFYDRRRAGNDSYFLNLEKDISEKLISALKLSFEEEGKIISAGRSVYTSSCCKRAFLRGAFLAAGSMTDPEKDYHMEFACSNEKLAFVLVEIIADFSIEAKTVRRKKQTVVYIKDSENIVDLLNVIEAHTALMDMENVRILKDMRNKINRRVNCETSNIRKISEVSLRQIEDIDFIEQTIGLDELGEGLSETARLRKQYPDASLAELGNLHVTKVGKSGVNHRLAKILKIAQGLRNTGEQ